MKTLSLHSQSLPALCGCLNYFVHGEKSEFLIECGRTYTLGKDSRQCDFKLLDNNQGGEEIGKHCQ